MFRRASLAATANAVLLFAIIAFYSPPVLAQLDTPRVTPVVVDRSSVRFLVTAGASGAPAGFAVEWMTRAAFDALGTWPTDPNHPDLARCQFTGEPTLTVTPGVPDFALKANVSAIVEIGDLHDETGVTSDDRDELTWHTEYVFRVSALASGATASDFSSTIPSRTDPGGADCLFSQGFWKNHPDLWPTSFLQLGSVIYSASQLLDIFHEPARGNGLVFLAHQLIAAKLNLGAGADPAAAQSTIDVAETLIGSLVVPPVGNGHVDPADASDLTEELDAFNNGERGVECNPVAVEASAWGAVKKLYH